MPDTKEQLNKVLTWVRHEGGRSAFNRLRLKLLPQTLAEGICLDDLDASEKISSSYINVVRQKARDIIGREAPF